MRRFKTQLNLVRAALMLLIALLTTGTAWAQFSGGSGTQADPYRIATVDDLNQLANNVNSGTKYSNTYFVMTTDITYSYEGLGDTESNYTTIGNSENRYFAGHFDGQNHTLSGIRLYKGGNNQSDRVQGVFGWIHTAEVKNLILADAKFAVHSFSGCIAGSNHYGYISGCHVLSDVTIRTPASYAFNVGGIAGYNMGTVTGCTSAASIVNIYSDNEDNGGVVGYNNETGTVSDCLFLGNTLGNPEKKVYGLGAIVGLNKGTVRNSFYTSTTIQGMDGNGNLLANEESAVGQNNGTVSNCGSDWSNEFFVNGDEYTIQTATGWNIFYSLMYHNDLFNRFSGKTVKLGADISITHPAGSAGHEFMGTFDGDYHTLTVNITDTTTQGTAPFREIRGATIRKLITTGSVNGTLHAAGLVGFARGNSSVTNTIERCKVATNVTVTTAVNGNYHCGGVVGHALNSTLNISNTVYCGAINNSGNYVGGFQGWSDGNTVNLGNCLFTGSYEGGGVFHPMAVHNRNAATTATVNNSFYSATPTLTNAQFIAANGTKTVGVATIPATLGSEVETLNFMTVYEGGMLFDGLYYAAPILSTDSDGAFVINNASDWEYFCEDLQDNDTWNRFSGKTVKLGADISVTRMAGSSGHDFCGTFDGGHHKLTFTSTEDVNGVAPFSYISTTLANPDDAESSPASIKNLNVVCDITTAATHASGLVGRAWGVLNIEGCTVSGTITTSDKYACGFIGEVNCSPANITNCRSIITVISNVEGDGTHGGFVGRTTGNSSLNIEGSIFDGKLLTTGGTTNCGGFVGWRARYAWCRSGQAGPQHHGWPGCDRVVQRHSH